MAGINPAVAPGPSYRFGPYTLDASRRRLSRDGNPLMLPPKTVELLLLLLERPFETVEKDEIMRRLWPDTVVEEANLTQHVFTLRKVLGERAGESRFIATVPRRGYRFLAEVHREPGEAPPVRQGPPDGPRALRLDLLLPDDARAARLPVPVLALSPDGRELVYVARTGSTTALFRRPLDGMAPQRIAGTEGAVSPFWSPDGLWIAFAAAGHIRRVPRSGGAAQVLADAATPRGACWTASGEIVYAPGPADGLWMVRADGSDTPRQLTHVDFAEGERTHRWPDCLPGSRTVLFTIGTAGIASFDDARVAAVSLDTGAHRVVMERASNPRAASDHTFLFLRGRALFAASIDDALAVSSPYAVADGLGTETTGLAHVAVAGDTLVFMPGGPGDMGSDLCWADGADTQAVAGAPAGAVEEPRLSPDGRRLAAGVRAATSDIWITDLARGVASRLTSEHDNFAAVWTPDGERLTYAANPRGPANIFWRRSDGAGEATALVTSEYDLVPGSWSPDGACLLYTEYHPATGADIWAATLPGGTCTPVLRTRFNEYAPMWSPRGEWFACTSDESGAPQVYLRRFSDGARVQVTADGGAEPLWSRDGRRLFYRAGARLMSVEVAPDGGHWTISAPRVALESAGEAGNLTGLPSYDVGPDGSRFVIVVPRHTPTEARALGVMLNWAGPLRRAAVRAPA